MTNRLKQWTHQDLWGTKPETSTSASTVQVVSEGLGHVANVASTFELPQFHLAIDFAQTGQDSNT